MMCFQMETTLDCYQFSSKGPTSRQHINKGKRQSRSQQAGKGQTSNNQAESKAKVSKIQNPTGPGQETGKGQTSNNQTESKAEVSQIQNPNRVRSKTQGIADLLIAETAQVITGTIWQRLITNRNKQK